MSERANQTIITIATVVIAVAALLTAISTCRQVRKAEDANMIAREKLAKEIEQVYGQVGQLLKESTTSLGQGKPLVEITNLQNGARVHHAVLLSGTVKNLPEGMELWAVKEISRGNFHPDRGPTFVRGANWSTTAYVGNATSGADTGIEFTIHIVMASLETGRKFNDYINMAHRTGNWSGINTLYDGKIVATVKVIRDDSAH